MEMITSLASNTTRLGKPSLNQHLALVSYVSESGELRTVPSRRHHLKHPDFKRRVLSSIWQPLIDLAIQALRIARQYGVQDPDQDARASST